jgi:hypothetical protein
MSLQTLRTSWQFYNFDLFAYQISRRRNLIFFFYFATQSAVTYFVLGILGSRENFTC